MSFWGEVLRLGAAAGVIENAIGHSRRRDDRQHRSRIAELREKFSQDTPPSYLDRRADIYTRQHEELPSNLTPEEIDALHERYGWPDEFLPPEPQPQGVQAKARAIPTTPIRGTPIDDVIAA